jgi:tetratricopeptide (TPR) repeat protein
MLNKIGILTMILLLGVFNFLFADKPLERLGNEAEYSGDEFYKNKEYLQAAEMYEEAQAKFQEAIEKDGLPIQEKVINMDDKLWKAYYFGGSYQEAIAVLKKMLARNNDEKTATLIAQIYEKNVADIDSAISFLQEFNSKERNYDVEKRIANLYYKKDDLANALSWFQKAYELRQDRDLISNIATIYLKMGKQQEAINAYDDFIKTNPPSSVLGRTYKNMGALYEEIGNMTKAAEYYEKSNSMRFESDVTLKLIDIYYEDDKYDKALSKIDLLIKNSPRNKKHGIYYRAMIRYNRGDFTGARADFSQLLGDATYNNFAKQFIESIDSR